MDIDGAAVGNKSWSVELMSLHPLEFLSHSDRVHTLHNWWFDMHSMRVWQQPAISGRILEQKRSEAVKNVNIFLID